MHDRSYEEDVNEFLKPAEVFSEWCKQVNLPPPNTMTVFDADYKFDLNDLMVSIPHSLFLDQSTFKFTFDEDLYLLELLEYIKSTYKQHYVAAQVQTTERIIQNGHGTGFCMGNIGKYVDRYGKKNGYVRRDLMKLLHYAVIQLYVHDKENLDEKVA